jgi:uncharacterized membrane protein
MVCPSCSAEVAAGGFCIACGARIQAPAGAAAAAIPNTASSGLSDNAAGALAYVTVIPAIVFLLMPEYNQRPFVRFHAFQCVFLAISAIAAQIVLMVVPVVGWIISPFVMLGFLVIRLIALIKALYGKKFKLPVIGAFAEQQAGG